MTNGNGKESGKPKKKKASKSKVKLTGLVKSNGTVPQDVEAMKEMLAGGNDLESIREHLGVSHADKWAIRINHFMEGNTDSKEAYVRYVAKTLHRMKQATAIYDGCMGRMTVG